MILGRDLTQKLGLDILNSDKRFKWNGIEVDMVPPGHWSGSQKRWNVRNFRVEQENHEVKKILESKYEKADLPKLIEGLTYLDQRQRKQLLQIMLKYEPLFAGKVGKWKGKPIDIILKEDAKPYHAKAYRVPQAYLKVFKDEIDRLVEIGTLSPVIQSDWASPTFCVPKKDQRIRIVSDFRILNSSIRRSPWPTPNIQEIFHEIGGFTYVTAIDLNMGYYAMALTERSKDICTIVLPWGKYRYNSLPMGVCIATDVFQQRLAELVAGIPHVYVFIDDILIVGKQTYEKHIEQVGKVLRVLMESGMQVNPLKSFWAQGEVDYLGYVISRRGIRPQFKKIQAILGIKPPNNQRQLRRFIGMINYYRDVWRGRSHYLEPLTQMVGKRSNFKWGNEQQQAFDKLKSIVSEETMLRFPNFRQEFVIHTDASDYQLGAVVSQEGKPIAFFSRKLNKAQRKYATIEKELLSIAECLKEYKTMLKGQKITIYTDHKNLTYPNTDFSSDRVLRQRLTIDEYGAKLVYIKGSHNIVADALSRLDMGADIPMTKIKGKKLPEMFLNRRVYSNLSNDFPLQWEKLAEEQQKDNYLRKLSHDPKKVRLQKFHNDIDIFTFKTPNTNEWKIYVPETLQMKVIKWYHSSLNHPGEDRSFATISQHFHWRGIKNDIKNFVKACPTCQIYKRSSRQYGLMPLSTPETTPWNTIQIDTIGPWKLKKGNVEIEFLATTIIDPATCWPEFVLVHNKSAPAAANALDNQWLCRYPRPVYCIHDNGNEFLGLEFQELLQSYGIISKPTTVKNPQANSVVERVHLVITNQLRSIDLDQEKISHANLTSLANDLLQSAAWAVRTTVHTVHQRTPGQLVFERDMIMQLAVSTDWDLIRRRKRHYTQLANQRENLKRLQHDYKPGDKVLIRLDKLEAGGKLGKPTEGPFRVLLVHGNGTLTIQRGAYREKINIRRLRPFFETA